MFVASSDISIPISSFCQTITKEVNFPCAAASMDMCCMLNHSCSPVVQSVCGCDVTHPPFAPVRSTLCPRCLHRETTCLEDVSGCGKTQTADQSSRSTTCRDRILSRRLCLCLSVPLTGGRLRCSLVHRNLSLAVISLCLFNVRNIRVAVTSRSGFSINCPTHYEVRLNES